MNSLEVRLGALHWQSSSIIARSLRIIQQMSLILKKKKRKFCRFCENSFKTILQNKLENIYDIAFI